MLLKVSSINDITKVAFLNNTKLKNSREISFMTKQRGEFNFTLEIKTF